MVYHLNDCKLFCLNDLARTDAHRRFLTSFFNFSPGRFRAARSHARAHARAQTRTHEDMNYNSQNKSTVKPIYNGHRRKWPDDGGGTREIRGLSPGPVRKG